MARISASVYTSHVPAIGAALDHGKAGEPYWQKVFAGYDFSKQWLKQHQPDVIFLVFNDHATAFSLEMIPTFAIGTAAEYAVADEGWGPRPVPKVIGHPELASHIAQSVIQQDFDLTIVNKMDVDHGLTVPLSLMCGQTDAWPCPVIPFAVNVVQYPPPSGRRCYNLGKAIRKLIVGGDFPGPLAAAITRAYQEMARRLEREDPDVAVRQAEHLQRTRRARLQDDPRGRLQFPILERQDRHTRPLRGDLLE